MNVLIEWPGLTWLGIGVIFGSLIGFGIAYGAGIGSRRRLAARADLAELKVRHHEELVAERSELMQLASERLTHRFDKVAGDHFRQQADTLIKLARETLGAQQERAHLDLAQKEHAIENLVKPIQDTLKKTELRLAALDRAGQESHGSIKEQLASMAAGQSALVQETKSLVNALKRPEVRGQWGELTLKRLVELAGMVEHCDFDLQSSKNTADGVIRPDMVVRLPDERVLVVDVKTPLDAYLEAIEANTDGDRRRHLKRHATIVADRIRELSAKGYWSEFDTAPEFVILFIPGDQFLSAALQERSDLLEFALQNNIILATPTSFVALLKAVAYGWQQVKLADSAAEIRSLGVQLYERLATFSSHVSNLGKAVGDSVKAYNQAVGSLEKMVLPSARRFTELGIQPRRDILKSDVIEESIRIPNETGIDA